MQAPPDFSLFWRHSSLQIASKSQRNNHINITHSYIPQKVYTGITTLPRSLLILI